jgi:ribonuclease BN (tRNA processing enzyme)
MLPACPRGPGYGGALMHVQIVGCGDAFGTGGRFHTCYHLRGRETNALLDCGASSLVALNRLGIDRNAIDVILLSHFHADHIGGVPFFMLEANYVLKRERPLLIAGPPGLRDRYAQWMELSFPGSTSMELRFPLTLQELTVGERATVGPLGVTPWHVVHDDRAGPCLGLRVEAEGKLIAFSGDTQWTDTLIEVGRGADLFICECYTREKPIATHMALATLERHLAQIRPKKLLLTHMSADMLARRNEVPYATAEDGMIVEL